MPPIPSLKRRKPPPGLLGQASETQIDWPARLTHWAFLLALVTVAARAMMTEVLREPFDPLPGSEAAPRGPGPSISLLLDLLCCLPALLVLLRRILDPTYVIRFSGSHPILGALALWMAFSVTWASDRFAAWVSAANFISALALLWSATQLVRSWARLRLVAGLAFGLLLIYLAAGLNYRYVDFPRQVHEWNDPNSPLSRYQYLKDRGLKETDFEFRRFEANVLSGDLHPFGNSANTYAAVLVLLSIITFAILLQRRANKDPLGWAIALLLGLAPLPLILYHTHSRTAFITPLLAMGILASTALLRPGLARHARKLYWAGVVILLLGAAAIVAHGIYHNSLFIKTLTFRWYYWTGAARLVAEHPFAGVGWASFGEYYPAVRSALATEEVKDPHNFLVRAFAELGIVGGLLMLAWMLRLWWELTTPVVPSAPPPTPIEGQRRGILFLALPAAAAVLLNLVLTIDWSQPQAYIAMQLLYGGGALLLLLLGLAIACFESLKQETIDERPAPWILYGILAALGIFLVHNLIDFSLFEPGPLFLFALLAGSALGIRHPSLAGRHRKTLAAMIGSTTAIIVWLAGVGMLWAPTWAAESAAAAGDQAMRRQRFIEAATHYGEAIRYQPANADYAFRAAQALAYQGESRLAVLGMIETAIQTNPRVVRYYLWQAAYELHQSKPDPLIIQQDFQNALRLNPREVGIRLQYAEALAKLGESTAAIEQYREALHLDQELPSDEPKRLSPDRRSEIEQRIQSLGNSAPADDNPRQEE